MDFTVLVRHVKALSHRANVQLLGDYWVSVWRVGTSRPSPTAARLIERVESVTPLCESKMTAVVQTEISPLFNDERSERTERSVTFKIR